MSKTSSRRSFLKGGALAAAPLAAAATPAMAGSGDELARLRDQAMLRELHQSWLRRLAAGEPFGDDVASLVPDHTGEPDLIELAADGASATGRFHVAVDIVEALPGDCTFAQMARLQGNGPVRRTERRVLNARYLRAGDGWRIDKVELGT